MASTSTSATRLGDQTQVASLLATRRRARLNEALLGLLFIAPVAIIGFLFQLFPVIYGFYISLQGGRGLGAFPEGFVGLENFAQAVGSLAYMLALAFSLIFAIAGYLVFRRAYIGQKEGSGNFWPYLIPGFISGTAILIFFFLAFRFNLQIALLPGLIALIGGILFAQLNTQRHTHRPEIATRYVASALGTATFSLASVVLALFALVEINSSAQRYLNMIPPFVRSSVAYIYPLDWQMILLGGMAAGVAAIFVINHVRSTIEVDMQPRLYGWLGFLRLILILLVGAFLVYNLAAQASFQRTIDGFTRAAADSTTGSQISDAIKSIRATLPEEERRYGALNVADVVQRVQAWPEVFTMIMGIAFVGFAWHLWQSARQKETAIGMFGTLGIALSLMIGGWLFIGEIPQAASTGDPKFYDSLVRTATYALLTVPVQLGIGLTLAYMLFHEVRWGKGFFRLIFFIPYIAPSVATAAVFISIFGGASTSPMNTLMASLNLPAQEWLQTQRGVFQIIAEIVGGRDMRLPDFLAGPSLPLLSAILYSIWVFSGYNAVIFMAGLGNVPKEIYEAAQVDGAGRWVTFRKIVFPLISPTTFFLTLLAVVGTFRAFTHLWVLNFDRRGALDTTAIYIYTNLKTQSQPQAYSAALSFLLFGIILVLTIFQNRYSRDRVFYG